MKRHRNAQLVFLLLFTCLVLLLPGTSRSGKTLTTVRVAPIQQMTALLRGHSAYGKPTKTAHVVEYVAATRPLTDERTILPVLGHYRGGGTDWLLVRLPGRPNGHTGWIVKKQTQARHTGWFVVIDTSRRRVLVYQWGHLVRTAKAVVGKPSTPTPRGKFFVEEVLKLNANEVGAPYAIALSARSNVFQEFEGGPGQIALHGTANVGGTLGMAQSHGCIRLSSEMMIWLVAHVGRGAPVTIR